MDVESWIVDNEEDDDRDGKNEEEEEEKEEADEEGEDEDLLKLIIATLIKRPDDPNLRLSIPAVCLTKMGIEVLRGRMLLGLTLQMMDIRGWRMTHCRAT